MKKVISKFNSFQEAEEAEYAYWASLTGEEKLIIFFEMIKKGQQNGAIKRCVRILKLAELKES